MFPLFHSFHSQFSLALNFLYLPILYYKHPIPSTPTNRPLPQNPHPHLPHPHHHSPPRLTPDPPFPFLSPQTCPPTTLPCAKSATKSVQLKAAVRACTAPIRH